MLLAVISGFAAALAAPRIHRLSPTRSGWLLGMVPLALCAFFLYHVARVPQYGPMLSSWTWVPALGVNLSFHADGLALLFAVLISGIGFLVIVYSGGYLHGHTQLGRWYAYLLGFMASMLGLVLSDNLIALFIFWELTSLTSYLLIGFHHEDEESRKAALQALLVTGLGGLAMLAGMVLLARAGGSMELSELLDRGVRVKSDPQYLAITVLILAGAFTKSAQFPFHFWLPNAMAAPTPASAYLHSSTMVKAGIYLLARLHPVLGGTGLWENVLLATGAITFLLGAWLALQQRLLKRLLAYSTISALGAMTMLLGLGNAHAVEAALAFLFAHALYKAALFLTAGAIDHETGERRVGHLGGLAKAMPRTAAAATLAALSMAGIPLLAGFWAKELLYDSTLHAGGRLAVTLCAVSLVSSMCFIAVAACVVLKPFFGPSMLTPKHPHEPPVALWLGPAVLGVLSLAFGLWPAPPGFLVRAASGAVLGTPSHLALSPWPGINAALALSALTWAGGALLYAGLGGVQRIGARLDPLARNGPDRWYDWALEGMIRFAHFQTRVLQNGYLRTYLLTIVLAVLAIGGVSLFPQSSHIYATLRRQIADGLANMQWHEAGLAALLVAAIGAVVHSRTKLAAVAGLGVVGYGIALVFVFFGAPDLAMTQFVIETLTVILFVLVFYHLPSTSLQLPSPVAARNLVVAIALGLLMSILVLVAADSEGHPRVADYFVEHSLDLAHGRNIVNVILVDFRGIDTMGEITVLGVAGVGAFALLKLRLGRRSGP
jgi:multicomponent Na+:H+ antiporter subunit A